MHSLETSHVLFSGSMGHFELQRARVMAKANRIHRITLPDSKDLGKHVNTDVLEPGDYFFERMNENVARWFAERMRHIKHSDFAGIVDLKQFLMKKCHFNVPEADMISVWMQVVKPLKGASVPARREPAQIAHRATAQVHAANEVKVRKAAPKIMPAPSVQAPVVVKPSSPPKPRTVSMPAIPRPIVFDKPPVEFSKDIDPKRLEKLAGDSSVPRITVRTGDAGLNTNVLDTSGNHSGYLEPGDYYLTGKETGDIVQSLADKISFVPRNAHEAMAIYYFLIREVSGVERDFAKAIVKARCSHFKPHELELLSTAILFARA